MFSIRVFVPASFVFSMFLLGHLLFIGASTVHTSDNPLDIFFSSSLDMEEPVIDGSNTQLPMKYKYLKIENIFMGKFAGSDDLFSLEVAVVTFQSVIDADFFIEKLREIEPDLVSEITKVVVDIKRASLTEIKNRHELRARIRDHLNEYLDQKGIFPGITNVYLINSHII